MAIRFAWSERIYLHQAPLVGDQFLEVARAMIESSARHQDHQARLCGASCTPSILRHP
ncbi:hypothetical protein CUJ84_pRLN1000087 (plasmid) [Rhizobium leguminosarum]|uniref:Uncharacterized protein n=1 Tax=Rhizobium leguminosarum TaxID=384 RepID=A0A2K9ZBC3_RHILE|nr:hypothetical protein CUJ84_pRLN1000087 [Rhizobium leguminosarum]